MEAFSLLAGSLNDAYFLTMEEWKKGRPRGHSSGEEYYELFHFFGLYMDKAKDDPPSPRVKELCAEIEKKFENWHW